MNTLAPTMTNSRYRILGEVGQGQFGKVFCGCDRMTGQLFALKSLDLLKFPTRSFLRELAVLVQLNHPNIANFYGIEYSRAGRYIVIDYCEGGTLRQLMDSKIELSLAQKLILVQDILQGLEHTHGHRIIHCDLKPENILLNVSNLGWRAKIADFGIAHFMGNPEDPSKSSGDTGSPAYMAPERFYGRYSPESDLYAIGVLLFELVAGWRPFSGMPADVMKAHMNQPLRLPKTIPTLLKAILRKALQKLPQHRYGSATEMRLLIETVITTLHHDSDPLPFQSVSASATHTLLDSLNTDTEILPGQVELRDEVKTPLQSPARLSIRQMRLKREQLECHTTLEQPIHQLWMRPQGCFILSGEGELTLSQVSTEMQPLGTLPLCSPFLLQQPLILDLDPQGKRVALLDTPLVDPPNAENGEKSANLLQILNLPELRAVCQRPLNDASYHLVWSNSRHVLVAYSPKSNGPQAQPITQLQLWNRRGQFYWSNTLPITIQQVALSRTIPNQVFAIADDGASAGLLIDLCPFKVQRIPLPMHPAWISPTRWGTLLVSVAGHLVCLNRRGRMVAEAQLPIEPSETIRAITTADPSTAWIALQTQGQSHLYTLDLGLHLPRSLLKL